MPQNAEKVTKQEICNWKRKIEKKLENPEAEFFLIKTN